MSKVGSPAIEGGACGGGCSGSLLKDGMNCECAVNGPWPYVCGGSNGCWWKFMPAMVDMLCSIDGGSCMSLKLAEVEASYKTVAWLHELKHVLISGAGLLTNPYLVAM